MSLNDLLIYLAVATFGLSLLFLHRYMAIRKALKTDIEIYLWDNKYSLLRYNYKFKGRKDGLIISHISSTDIKVVVFF